MDPNPNIGDLSMKKMESSNLNMYPRDSCPFTYVAVSWWGAVGQGKRKEKMRGRGREGREG